MNLHTDQATLDRWLADGTWVQFGESEGYDVFDGVDVVKHGNPPPADWEADQKCPVMIDGEHPVEHDGAVCWHCNGTGLRRHPVTVPCPDCSPGNPCCSSVEPDGRITVAWATVEWGVVGPIVVVLPVGDQWALRAPGYNRFADKPAPVVALPPDIDPQSLVGQWARGGSIEAATCYWDETEA